MGSIFKGYQFSVKKLKGKHGVEAENIRKNQVPNIKALEHERKSMKIKIAKLTIIWGFVLLLVWGLSVVFVMVLPTILNNGRCCKLESTNEIGSLSPIISGIVNIITLALGFVAGTSID